MAVEAVLFDLDDTLYDHSFASRAALRALRRQDWRLRSISPAELESRTTALLDRVHREEVLTGRLTIEEGRALRMQRLYAALGHRLSNREAERLAREWVRFYARAERPVPGAGPLLRALRRMGVRVGIISNNLVAEQEGKLRRCGLFDLVDFTAYSEEVGAMKPDPKIFRVALERGGSAANRTVMVGDSWTSDVLGARRLGIPAVWLNRTGARCPDRSVAREIRSLRPADRTSRAIAGR
jgi:HAD superfamily hydrolase (TIGR01549 family)